MLNLGSYIHIHLFRKRIANEFQIRPIREILTVYKIVNLWSDMFYKPMQK